MLKKSSYENFQNWQGLPQELRAIVKPKQTSSQVQLTQFTDYVKQLVQDCEIQDYKPNYSVEIDSSGRMDISSLRRERET